MTKRSFIKSLFLSAVAPSILVPELKDRFVWRPARRLIMVADMPYCPRHFMGKWVFIEGVNGIWVANTPHGVITAYNLQGILHKAVKQ